MPSLPASRTAHIRQRGEETPSHPGGLSETGRKRLEEFKRNRERQRGELYANVSQCACNRQIFQRVLRHIKNAETTVPKASETFNAARIATNTTAEATETTDEGGTRPHVRSGDPVTTHPACVCPTWDGIRPPGGQMMVQVGARRRIGGGTRRRRGVREETLRTRMAHLSTWICASGRKSRSG